MNHNITSREKSILAYMWTGVGSALIVWTLGWIPFIGIIALLAAHRTEDHMIAMRKH